MSVVCLTLLYVASESDAAQRTNGHVDTHSVRTSRGAICDLGRDACTGDYKRLAVAWVSLPDQLAQPEKLIEVPKSSEELETEIA